MHSDESMGGQLNGKAKLLDSILNQGILNYLHTDESGIITDINSSTAAVLGIDSASLSGKNVSDLFPGYTFGVDTVQEAAFLRADGSRLYFKATEIPSEYAGRHIILQDVTEAKKLDLKLNSTFDFLGKVKDAIPDIVILKNPEGIWSEWNKRAAELLDQAGTSEDSIHMLSPECAISDKEAWKKENYLRIDERLSDGQVYDVVKIPFRNSDGSPRCLLTIARDVTGRTHRIEKIDRLNIIMRALRAIDRLILDAGDTNVLSEKAVQILTDSGAFSSCSIFLLGSEESESVIYSSHCHRNTDLTEYHELLLSEFRTASVLSSEEIGKRNSLWLNGPGSGIPKETLVSPLIYQTLVFGYLLACPSEAFLKGDSELSGVFTEIAEDIGYAVYGIRLAREKQISALQIIQAKNTLNSFMENLPGPAFIRTEDSEYLHKNSSFSVLVGSNNWNEESPGKIHTDEDIIFVNEWNKKVLETGYASRNMIATDDDGNKCTIEMHYFRIDVQNNKPLVGGLGLYATDRIKAEKALAKSEELYRTIYQSTGTAMGILGPDGMVVSVNANAKELVGYDIDEIVNKKAWTYFIHPQDLQSVAEQREKRLKGDPSKHQEYEFRLIRKDGGIRNIRMRTGTIPDSAGMAVISLSDVTSLLDYQKQMKISLVKTKAILKAIPDLMFVLSRDGVYVDFHAGDTSQLVFQADKLEGKGIFDIGLPGRTASEIQSIISETIDTGIVHTVEYELDLPDGHHFYEAGMSPFEADTVLVLCRDVTLRKEAETERVRLQEKMQHVQKLESLGVMAGGIAHDFNNILMAIAGNAHLARELIKNGEDPEENISAIEKSSGRASDLAGQMLAYSGRGDFRIEPLDLNTVADDISDMLKVTVSKKAVMQFDLDENLPLILADVTQVRQILMNLITNASEALEGLPGTIKLSTGVVFCDRQYLAKLDTIEKLPTGNYAYMEVTDSGMGISEEVRKKIFNPFFTTKFTGRGLGLSAVIGILRSHNGAIKIDSIPGKGSTFRVLFPVSSSGREDSPDNSVVCNEILNGDGTVLFVDDEPQVRAVAEAMLNHSGLSVITAVDGVESLKLFKEHEIDLVIMDITMPNMDGDEAFREMRKLNKSVPVIISSGYSENEIIARFSDDYPDAFLRKPYRASELKSKVKALLNR